MTATRSRTVGSDRRPAGIVTDLDGTFWYDDGEVHPATLAAIAELRRRDVPLLFATGRRGRSASHRLARHDLLGPAVLLAGAVGTDLHTGQEWHRQAFAPEAGLRVLDAFLAEGLSPVVHVSLPDIDAIIAPDCPTSDRHRAQFDMATVPTDPHEPVAAGVAVGFGLLSLTDERGLAAHRVATAIAGDATVTCGLDTTFGGITVLAAPVGVNKVTGISRWATAQGLAADDLLAVGDGENDLDMLAWAGHTVAIEGSVANGIATDHVIDVPERGGWAGLLELLG